MLKNSSIKTIFLDNVMILKNKIQKFFNLFGYRLEKINNKHENDLDFFTKLLIRNNPLIFDVGANKGQSINRYKKLFPDSTIHAFEPIKKEYDELLKKHKDDNSIFLNNFALGNFNGDSEFNLNYNSAHSSFKNLNLKSKWLLKTSSQSNIEPKKYTIQKSKVHVKTIESYFHKNKLNKIDILKIDTQGYEDKVLEGAIDLIVSNKIKLIQIEMLFTEVYDQPLSIYDVEKYLVPNGYKLFCSSSKGGSLHSELYQQDHIYISPEIFENYKNT